MTKNLSIISPEKITFGFQNRQDYKLAFATYKDKKGNLYKETSFNNWVDKNISLEEYENKPISGFKIHSLTQRSRCWFGNGRHVWRIEDPRGFVLEISSENFQALIEECEIKNGLINADCLWCWSSGYMSLIPTCSDLYKDVISNNERVQKKVSKKDIKIGNTIILKNGDECIYYGKYWILENDAYSHEWTVRQVEIVKIINEEYRNFSSFSKLEIAEIKDKSLIEQSKAIQELQEKLSSKDGLLSIKYLSVKLIKISDFYREEYFTENDYDQFKFDFKEIRNRLLWESLPYFKQDNSDKIYIVNKNHTLIRPSYGLGWTIKDPGYFDFNTSKIESNEKKIIIIKSSNNYSKDAIFRVYQGKPTQYYRSAWNEKYFETDKEFIDWLKFEKLKKIYMLINGKKFNL